MRNNKDNIKSKKGFTIIELTVVLVVIGILSATLLPRFFEQQKIGQAKSEFDKVTELSQRIEELYNGDIDYDGVSTTWLDQLPSSFSKKGNNVYSVWKNLITVGEEGTNGYYIEYRKVPKGMISRLNAGLNKRTKAREVFFVNSIC